jgi:hypothetical protein
MQTHQLRVLDAEAQLDELRAELMVFTDVLEVFSSARPDTIVIVCSGRPRPAEWVRALRAAGYTMPARHHAGRGRRAARPESRRHNNRSEHLLHDVVSSSP